MKYLLSAILFSILFFPSLKAQNISDTQKNFEVTLASNGYVYPQSGNGRSNNISDKGLVNWNDAKAFTRTFFYPQQAGTIKVTLKLCIFEHT